jgi:hypothetical protein
VAVDPNTDLPDSDARRQRLTQIFDYLHAYVQLRQPMVRHIRDQLWQLALDTAPEHPAIVHGQRPLTTPTPGMASEPSEALGDDFILRVRRPG